jgi:hypothetical protein
VEKKVHRSCLREKLILIQGNIQPQTIRISFFLIPFIHVIIPASKSAGAADLDHEKIYFKVRLILETENEDWVST